MSKRELKVIWLGIAAIVAALAFPPYGYDHLRTVYSPSVESIMLRDHDESRIVPWKYVGHAFILSPPLRDRDLDERASKYTEEAPADLKMMIHNYPRVQIGWHVLTVEIAIIALVAVGAFFTVRTSHK